jgi:predicted Rossmann fold flavoprotein
MSKKVLVIGGGAAGFFFAINVAARIPDAQVTILEQSKNVLSKVKVSGGGRCNVTHACYDPGELIHFYPRGSRELLGPFHKFCTGDMMAWLEDRGVEVKVEEDGRVFPMSDSSQTIIDLFMQEARDHGVDVVRSKKADHIDLIKKRVDCTDGSHYEGDCIFMATGSSPFIWKMLKEQGVNIIDPVPSLFTFKVLDERLKDLPGISFDNVIVHSTFRRYTSTGPLLITHWGLSAPAILKLSSFEAREMAAAHYKFNLYIDFLPDLTPQQVTDIGRDQGGKKIGDRNPFGLPKRYWQQLIKAIRINDSVRWADLPKGQLEKLVGELKNAEFPVEGKATFKEEFVSAGGVDLKEVDFRSFQLKKYPGVYACGEMLDIDAVTGGFNFQAAWTGAYVAAEAEIRNC